MKRKWAVRRVVSCLTVLLLCLCTMAGCRSEKSEGQPPAVVATVEADAVRYYKGTENYAFFVMEKDGVFRLIDHKGEAVTDRSFEEVYFGEAHPHSGRAVLKTWTEDHEAAMITADGRIGDSVTAAFGYAGESVTVVWYQGKAAMIYGDSDGQISEYSAARYKENPPKRCPGTIATAKASVVAVQEVLETVADANYEDVRVATKYSDRYALMDVESGTLITEFVYEYRDAVGFVDGLLAVKKDGHWGYVREDGTAVTPFVYEMISNESGREQLYAPVNGYIVVKKDGKFGLIDTDGNVVIDTQYEDVSQVNGDGYYWFKKGGTWSSAKVSA